MINCVKLQVNDLPTSPSLHPNKKKVYRKKIYRPFNSNGKKKRNADFNYPTPYDIKPEEFEYILGTANS